MRSNPRFILVAAAAALAIQSGCGRSAPDSSKAEAVKARVAGPHRREIKGSLVRAVSGLRKQKFIEPCDVRDRTIQATLARALDSRARKIEKAMSSRKPADGHRRVKVGPTFVRERIKPQEPEEGWQTQTDGWAVAYAAYEGIRTKPVGPDWIDLDGRVRSLIVNDGDRLAGAGNEYLDKDSGPFLRDAIAAIGPCAENDECVTPEIGPAVGLFLHGNYYYGYLLAKSEKPACLPGVQHGWIKTLFARLKTDYEAYEFRRNPSVTWGTGAELVLPLDPGPFRDGEARLAGYIESVWKSDDVQVRVDWREPPHEPEVFRILLGNSPGGRSFVSWEKRTVNLNPDVDSLAIAHEAGHVLGFPDRYYTTWNPVDCSYTDQYNDSDIMSGSSIGAPGSGDWVTLKSEYGAPGAEPAPQPDAPSEGP